MTGDTSTIAIRRRAGFKDLVRHAAVLLVLLIVVLASPAASAVPTDEGDIAVRVKIAGDVIEIAASFSVDVPHARPGRC